MTYTDFALSAIFGALCVISAELGVIGTKLGKLLRHLQVEKK